MPPVYSVAGHEQLTPKARALVTTSPERFDEENITAEQLLGLDTDVRDFTAAGAEAALDRIRRGIAAQINYSLATGVTARAQSSDTVGPISASYRGNAGGALPLVDSLALEFVEQGRALYDSAIGGDAATTVRRFTIAGSVRRPARGATGSERDVRSCDGYGSGY